MIHPDNALFFRVHVGEASEGKGKKKVEYEMSISAHDSTPIIHLPDGRWFTITWQELLDQAKTQAAEGAKPCKRK